MSADEAPPEMPENLYMSLLVGVSAAEMAASNCARAHGDTLFEVDAGGTVVGLTGILGGLVKIIRAHRADLEKLR